MQSRNSLLGAFAPPVKRKAFFSFHFDDVMRVNNVRNAWKITHPDSASMRSFYDSSLWESKKLEGDDAVKRLIREGVCNTSAVCVLAGTDTWVRRWVRYEIARAIIDKRGLLTVHINGIKHHKRLIADRRGMNPLAFMGVGKVQTGLLVDPKYYLFEKWAVMTPTGPQWSWERYQDYTDPVGLPSWLHDCQPGQVSILSGRAAEYDYVAGSGHQNIGKWIDQAAKAAGR
jgi:hypothetical protein